MIVQNTNPDVLRPHSSVSVEVTQYDPLTGQPIKTISSLNFGSAQLSNFTEPIVIKMNVKGVRKISNIKLGLISSSQNTESGGTKSADNTSTIGNIGIEHVPEFVPKTSLSSFFSGFNSDHDPSSSNNVLIKNVTDTESEFIYINVKSSSIVNRGNLYFRWFFNFS